MQVIRKMFHLIKSSIQLRKDMGLIMWSNKVKEMVENHYGVEPMMDIII